MIQPTTVFTKVLDGRTVHFTRHSVRQFQARLYPELSVKEARGVLKLLLTAPETRIYQGDPPRGIQPSWWSKARVCEWVVIDKHVVFPINQTIRGDRYAVTCMVAEDLPAGIKLSR